MVCDEQSRVWAFRGKVPSGVSLRWPCLNPVLKLECQARVFLPPGSAGFCQKEQTVYAE